MAHITQNQFDEICQKERAQTLEILKKIESDDTQRIILTDVCAMIISAANNYVQDKDIAFPPEALEKAFRVMAGEHKRITNRLQQIAKKEKYNG